MAIQIRRGTDAQWEVGKSQMKAGEPAVTLDTQRVFIGVGNGNSVELAKRSDVDSTETEVEALENRMDSLETDTETIKGTMVFFDAEGYLCFKDYLDE